MRLDISQLEFIDPKLRQLVVWLETETGLEFTITSLYRINDNGVHGTLPLRGIDLRMRNKDLGQEIEDIINCSWRYDITRPNKHCCILHGAGRNMHLHIQVSSNTEMI